MAKSGVSEELDRHWRQYNADHGLVMNWVEVMTASSGRQYSGQGKATEEDSDPETPGKSIWSKKYGQRASAAAGGRWRWQRKAELK